MKKYTFTIIRDLATTLPPQDVEAHKSAMRAEAGIEIGRVFARQGSCLYEVEWYEWQEVVPSRSRQVESDRLLLTVKFVVQQHVTA